MTSIGRITASGELVHVHESGYPFDRLGGTIASTRTRTTRTTMNKDDPTGVLISADGGSTWTEHGDVRLTPDDRYFGWAEPTICERADGSILMLIRADGLGGVLFKAVSPDGGRTWPEFASVTDIPNPGSKASLFSLGGDAVALLHNPDPRQRMPLALWISFDGGEKWPYQRVLVERPGPDPDRPAGVMEPSLNDPDGFVSADGQWLHFAYDDSRHRAVHYSAKLPPLQPPVRTGP